MRLSVSVKHSLLILFAILATASSLTITFLWYLNRQLEQEVTKRGWSTARQLAYLAAPLLLGNDVAKLSAAVKTVAQEPDIVSVAIFDHDNRLLASSPGKPPPAPLPAARLHRPLHRLLDDLDQDLFSQPASFGGVEVGRVQLRVNRLPLRSAVRSASLYVVLITLLAAGVVIVLSFFTLQHTIRPLREVIEGTGRISRGDFSTRLQVRTRDEIGDLAEAFNTMAARTELFFRYVDKSVAERLARDENLARPGGRLKPVSVLFGDMRGFTALANRREPSEVVWILNVYFHVFFQVVHRLDGVVDKTMGDAIMAFFESSPADEQPNARRAALAAVAMRGAVWLIAELVQDCRRWGWPLRLEAQDFGFSVATGKMIVGNVGSSRRMDYTVCGPAVNLASRLQQDTPRGEVLLDRFTALDVADLLQLRQLEQIQPKGFGPRQKVTPYQVTGLTKQSRETWRQLLEHSFDIDTLARTFTDAQGHCLGQVELRRLRQRALELVTGAPARFLVS